MKKNNRKAWTRWRDGWWFGGGPGDVEIGSERGGWLSCGWNSGIRLNGGCGRKVGREIYLCEPLDVEANKKLGGMAPCCRKARRGGEG